MGTSANIHNNYYGFLDGLIYIYIYIYIYRSFNELGEFFLKS